MTLFPVPTVLGTSSRTSNAGLPTLARRIEANQLRPEEPFDRRGVQLQVLGGRYVHGPVRNAVVRVEGQKLL